MFESDDLILRKNEKNFILCLLEIARFGAKFGVSVPNIIKLEQEIEREIERDKQTEKISFTELKHSQEEDENQKDQFNSTNNDGDNQINTDLLSNSNGANWLQQNILQFSNNGTQRQGSEESYDSIVSSEVTTAIVNSNEEPQFSHTIEEKQKPIEPPASSSHLHKTVSKKKLR
jgi:hypothetical protein